MTSELLENTLEDLRTSYPDVRWDGLEGGHGSFSARRKIVIKGLEAYGSNTNDSHEGAIEFKWKLTRDADSKARGVWLVRLNVHVPPFDFRMLRWGDYVGSENPVEAIAALRAAWDERGCDKIKDAMTVLHTQLSEALSEIDDTRLPTDED